MKSKYKIIILGTLFSFSQALPSFSIEDENEDNLNYSSPYNFSAFKSSDEAVILPSYENAGIDRISIDYTKEHRPFKEEGAHNCKDGWMLNALGLMYHCGQGVNQDYQKANIYYEKARGQGFAAASRNLGLNYYKGNGVEVNYTKARELLEEAEVYGHEEGQIFNLLGLMYHCGQGVSQDHQKANIYYEKARGQGFAAASRNLGLNYYKGNGVEVDYTKARELLEEAEVYGHEDVEMFSLLGLMYHCGQGVSQDYQKANIYYEKAWINWVRQGVAL